MQLILVYLAAVLQRRRRRRHPEGIAFVERLLILFIFDQSSNPNNAKRQNAMHDSNI